MQKIKKNCIEKMVLKYSAEKEKKEKENKELKILI